MSLQIFHFWTATVLTFFIKIGLKLPKEKKVEVIIKCGSAEAKI